MADAGILLNDKQMRAFIANGYAKVKADLPAAYHRKICRRLDETFDRVGQVGNNLLPLIPEIQEVFDDPAVRGAMRSILGPEYLMHPHRYCHATRPGSGGQKAHKDTYEGNEQVTRHRCRWTLAFYYPQDTTIEMGPSCVLPGTQYYQTDDATRGHGELPLCGEAGTVTIVHYDLWHRAMPNLSSKKRYMLKFLFTRLREPKEPSWHNESVEWQPPDEIGFSGGQDAMWRHIWSWNRGGQGSETNGDDSSPTPADGQLTAALGEEDETVALNAAYSLATRGRSVLPAAMDALRNGSESARRHATYALGAMGASATPELMAALEEPREAVRTGAAYALGEVGSAAAAAVPALTSALGDASAWVRRHAAEALGIMGDAARDGVRGLAPLLRDEHEWVRDNAARTLAKIGRGAEAAVPVLLDSLADESRYVRFHAAVALRQIDTEEAREALYHHLLTSRWCPLTTSEAPY